MPTFEELRSQQLAAFTATSLTANEPFYGLGIRHAAELLATALSDEELNARRPMDGHCWACGNGNIGNPVYELSRAVRYGSDSAGLLARMNTVIERIRTMGSTRNFHAVTMLSQNYYRRNEAQRTTHVALCDSCHGALANALAHHSARRTVGNCARCEHEISSYHLGDALNLSWLSETYRYLYDNDENYYLPCGISTEHNGETLALEIRTGRGYYVNSGRNTRHLCSDCDATFDLCYTCGVVHTSETGRQCNQCGYGNLCSDCYESGGHEDHFMPRDFHTPVSIRAAIAHAAHHARPGRTVRSTRTVGQEVETGGTGRVTPSARALRDLDAAARAALGTSVIANIGTDCSIELSDAYEIRGMPVAGYVAEIYAEGMAYALNNGNWTHNLSTGAHVHVGVTDREFWRAYAGHVLTQEIPIALSDPRRFEGRNRYCARINSSDVQRVCDLLTSHDGMSYEWLRGRMTTNAFFERYVTVNASAFGSHQTIEIRTGSGDLPHNAERNTHYLAWIAGATDYFVSDHGFAFLAGSWTLADIVADVAAQGHISAETAAHIVAALGNGGADVSEIESREADHENHTVCYECDCACDDCPCEDQNCGYCGCGSDPCEHEHCTRQGAWLECDNCGDYVSRV